ncbi:DUF2059 domain-containing protein [Faunimonas sp. B44]|uniref:DUF2059 domain-containing protein n=1 Tax=Faunimonas sp. B44 TaxID=3461493 RepID=UPI0040448340
MLFRMGAIALLLAAAPSAAFAASAVEKARFVVEASGASTSMKGVLDSMGPGILARIKMSYPGISDDDAERILATLNEVVHAHIPDLEEFLAEFYAGYFSEAEVNAMHDFYKTEIGAGIASKLTRVNTPLTLSTSVWASRTIAPAIAETMKNDPEVQAITQKYSQKH